MIETLAGKRILLTGGAGFIGHNMALALHRLGAKVDVMESLQLNNLTAFHSIVNNIHNRDLYLPLIHDRLQLLYESVLPFAVLDIRDDHMVSRSVRNVKPDA